MTNTDSLGSQVMAELRAKRLALEAQLQKMQAELEGMQGGEQIASQALETLEQLIEQVPQEIKPALFRSLFKALEQEAKRSGVELTAKVAVNAANTESNNGNGKRTRKTTEEIQQPSEFTIVQPNKRLAIDGVINDEFVRHSKVYVGVDGLRETAACEGSASVWKRWFSENITTTAIKVGNFFPSATLAGLDGNYIIELSEVSLGDLAKLISLDFSKSPTGDVNEALMERPIPVLKLLEVPAIPVEPDQVEEIRESEPVQLQSNTQPLLEVGTRFQVVGIGGYEGNEGTILAVHPNSDKPYECEVTGFGAIHPMLATSQVFPIPDDDESVEVEEEEEEEKLDIPF